MSRGVLIRFALLLLLLTMAFLLARRLAPVEAEPGAEHAKEPKALKVRVSSSDEPEGVSLTPELRSQLLAAARARLSGGKVAPVAEPEPGGTRLVMVSLSRPSSPAAVGVGRAGSLAAALEAAVGEAGALLRAEERAGARLKIDVLSELLPEEEFDSHGKSRLEAGPDGLWLPKPDLWLLPEEIVANRLVDKDGDLHGPRLRQLFASSARKQREIPGNPGKSGEKLRRAHFESLAEGPDGAPLALYRGNTLEPAITPASLLAAARTGGDYLVRHQSPDGQFDYLYEPQSDSVPSKSNQLRHAGTCYALFELYKATEERAYLEAGEKGLAALARDIRPIDAKAGEPPVLALAEDSEAKLGGAALALLAMLRHEEVAGPSAYREKLAPLGRFLVAQQDPDGHFRSKHFFGAPDPHDFDSIYYPGEAILALTRLHQLDGNPLLLATARKGADWLIQVRDAGKAISDLPHDHWLLIGLNDLEERTVERLYIEQAQKIAQSILEAQWAEKAPQPDWRGGFYDPPRSTPTATRGEALVAMVKLAERRHLPSEAYRKALVAMAAFQLRTQLRPENVLYLPRPDRSLGGFRRSLTVWEVRIDYVQHNLSSLLGLRSLLPS